MYEKCNETESLQAEAYSNTKHMSIGKSLYINLPSSLFESAQHIQAKKILPSYALKYCSLTSFLGDRYSSMSISVSSTATGAGLTLPCGILVTWTPAVLGLSPVADRARSAITSSKFTHKRGTVKNENQIGSRNVWKAF